MSCLFNSLAPAVHLHPEILRTRIANFLKTDPELLDDIKAKDIIAWTENKTLDEYANRMSRPGVWGGGIEIRAFCEMYAIDVAVHVLYTNKKFTIRSSKKANKKVHISYTGSHFEPMYIIIK